MPISPGYLTHEAAAWSDFHNQWFFLPRKVSREAYDAKKDETRCGNVLIKCNEDFTAMSFVTVGTLYFDILQIIIYTIHTCCDLYPDGVCFTRTLRRINNKVQSSPPVRIMTPQTRDSNLLNFSLDFSFKYPTAI